MRLGPGKWSRGGRRRRSGNSVIVVVVVVSAAEFVRSLDVAAVVVPHKVFLFFVIPGRDQRNQLNGPVEKREFFSKDFGQGGVVALDFVIGVVFRHRWHATSTTRTRRTGGHQFFVVVGERIRHIRVRSDGIRGAVLNFFFEFPDTCENRVAGGEILAHRHRICRQGVTNFGLVGIHFREMVVADCEIAGLKGSKHCS